MLVFSFLSSLLGAMAASSARSGGGSRSKSFANSINPNPVVPQPPTPSIGTMAQALPGPVKRAPGPNERLRGFVNDTLKARGYNFDNFKRGGGGFSGFLNDYIRR